MPQLPIDSALPDLINCLEFNRAAVLQAPPGAGKTTRVPLALLEQPWLGNQKIIMLEPRRLAARAAASFMAGILSEDVGETVGCRIRGDSRVGPETRIEVVTEGVLTRLLQADPSLEGVGLVIFDEFHERNLHADLGLTLCLDVQRGLRDDLKLLAMSATFDGEAIAKFIGNAPVVTSTGRQYPVEIRHIPRPPEGKILEAAATAVLRVLREEEGNMLVFLPGAGEIKRVEKMLLNAELGAFIDIDPLYGALPKDRQQAAIAPSPPGRRKVVLATSIAETSLTIEGIRIVVDAGLKRAPKFDPKIGLTRLETLNITKDSADQRCGRAGRLAPGICYRLWSERQHLQLLATSKPEILEADLAPLALELIRWGAGDPGELSWLTPPPSGAFAQALELLKRLGAVDGSRQLTRHGQAMAELPMHPRLAHMVLKGKELGVGKLACDLAALLDERDILQGSRSFEADVRLRLQALRGRGGSGKEQIRHIRMISDSWSKRLKVSNESYDLDKTGVLIALAFPDRIAQRRPGKAPRYKLANGRGAKLRDDDSLFKEPCLAAAHVDGGSQESQIFLAAPISTDEIREQFSDLIEEESAIVWDENAEAVAALRLEKFGELILSERKIENPDQEEAIKTLLFGLRSKGLQTLPWDKETENWRGRINLLKNRAICDGTDAESWPDPSDEALTDALEQWLGPHLIGMTRLSQVRKLNLMSILQNMLTWRQRKMLDQAAPTHFIVPTGSSIRIDYTCDAPTLAVRLQELFGLTETPSIASGRIPLTLHLLSPAMRPVQVTSDLTSFWENTYEQVKKDLKGRYPKHYWPDDPLKAEPVRGVRKQ